MTLYEIAITNHTGLPFYNWENPNRPKDIINVVKYTRYPSLPSKEDHQNFELECGYVAAMSLAAKSQGTHIASIKKRPISAEQFSEEGSEQDIIFDLSVDTYMNDQNLYYRIYRAVDNIIFNENRQRLEDGDLSKEEEIELVKVFNDSILRMKIYEKYDEINNKIKEILEAVKGQEKKFYEYGILGLGILSSSYNILFYNGLKTYFGLSDEELDIPGSFPDNVSDLDTILTFTQMPISIEGGESKFAYPYEQNYNFIIHNFDIGPIILGVKEPYHLIVCVRAGFPSKETIDDLIQAIVPFLLD